PHDQSSTTEKEGNENNGWKKSRTVELPRQSWKAANVQQHARSKNREEKAEEAVSNAHGSMNREAYLFNTESTPSISFRSDAINSRNAAGSRQTSVKPRS